MLISMDVCFHCEIFNAVLEVDREKLARQTTMQKETAP